MNSRSVLLFIALSVCASGVLTASHRRPIRSIKAPRETVHNYEVVRPTTAYEPDTRMAYPRELRVHLPVSPTINFTLIMKLNEHLLAPDFKIRFYDENGNQQVTKGHVNCFYQGSVEGHPDWTATLSTCHGLQATFGDHSNKDQLYHLEPLDMNDPTWEQDHALYLETEYKLEKQGVCGTNHSLDSPLTLLDTHQLQKSGRLRRQSSSYFVEWLIVSDSLQFQAVGGTITAAVQRSITVANEVNNQYQALGITPAVVVVLTETIVFNTGDRFSISTDSNNLLNSFRTFMQTQSVDYDSAMLLTGVNIAGNTVGIAFTNAMCSDISSVGVTQDGGGSIASVRSTASHELGHIFNMAHDDGRGCSCTDPSNRCIMSAVSGFPSPTVWSSCSVNDILIGLGNNIGISGNPTNFAERCLSNMPSMVVGGNPVCGNGLLENGEQCDCGNPQFCTNPCCNANTCQFVSGAECAQGSCCNLQAGAQQCRYFPYGSTCRQASNSECDITEYCLGDSASCPTDQHRQRGTACASSTAYCFDGLCPNLNAQCQTFFGTNAAPDICFDRNNRGDAFGNCGQTSTAYIACASADLDCGLLHCNPGDIRISGVGFGTLTIGSSGTQCRVTIVDLGGEQMNPGLVADGIRCGSDRLCQSQSCVTLASLNVPACPSAGGQVCGGNGLCNDNNQCSCNVGRTGPACGVINECLNNNGGCEQVCTETGESFTCNCSSGFVLASNGLNCNDINECASSNGGCQQVCENLSGSRRCSCNNGYTIAGNGVSCNDINECASNNGNCQTSCTNTVGSFFCSCNSGFELAGDDRSCVDVNECAGGTNGCQQHCVNLQGSFRCDCNSGFALDSNQVTCSDDNECSTNNGNCEGSCFNTFGSFFCTCPGGFVLASNQRDCNDINEFPPSTPTNLASPSQSPTSITLSWEQPAGDAVDRYDIVYTYQGGCSDYTQPENMATVNDGSAREYTLQNLQEFSGYEISIVAVNATGVSIPAVILGTTSKEAPSGPPQSVMMSSVTSSSITVQWGHISCIDHNSEITGYTVRYGQTGSTTTVMESVSGTSDSDRMFTASGLIPRTNYTFEVAAVSSEGIGPFSTGTTVETLKVILFQVRLVGQLDCGVWIASNNQQKRDDIAQHIMGGVEELCNCGFSRQSISDDAFQCFSADAVTYRGTLHGTAQASSLLRAGFIEQWTAGEQVIPVQGVFLTVDSSCSVIIESLREVECGTATTDRLDSTASLSDNLPSPLAAIIAGVVVAIGVVAIAIIAVTISVAFIVVKSRTKRTEGPVTLKDLTVQSNIATAPCPAYEPTEIQSHDYEDLTQYSVPEYEQIKPDPPPARVRSGASQEGGGREELEEPSMK